MRFIKKKVVENKGKDKNLCGENNERKKNKQKGQHIKTKRATKSTERIIIFKKKSVRQ